MSTKKRSDEKRGRKRLIALVLLGLGGAIYAPLLKSWFLREPKVVSDSEPKLRRGEARPETPELARDRGSHGEAAAQPAATREAPSSVASATGAGGIFAAARPAAETPAADRGALPRLEGLLRFGGDRIAIFDGAVVGAGDSLAGGWVEEIRDQQVLFRNAEGLRELRLGEPAALPSPSPVETLEHD